LQNLSRKIHLEKMQPETYGNGRTGLSGLEQA
jgi:hypothetical protein